MSEPAMADAAAPAGRRDGHRGSRAPASAVSIEPALTIAAAKSRIRGVHEAIVAQADAAARILAETAQLTITGRSARVQVSIDGQARLHDVAFTAAARGSQPAELRRDFMAALHAAYADLDQHIESIAARTGNSDAIAQTLRRTLTLPPPP